MKINENVVVAYARSPRCIDKQGYLNKKGGRNHAYKRRWFVLKGNLLFYFENPDNKPLGMIVLENCSIEVSDADRHSFCVRFKTDGSVAATRIYVLTADSDGEMESWIKTLTSASYTYMATVVRELEKTLREFKAQRGIIDHVDFTVGEFDAHSDSETRRTKTTSSKKQVSDMFTVAAPRKEKNKKYKTLDIRRSRSSDNIIDSDKLPSQGPVAPRRKSKHKPNKHNKEQRNGDVTEPAISFEKLHLEYRDDIFSKIGETI